MDFRKLSNDLLSFLYENNLLYDYFTQNSFNLLSSKIEGDLIRNIYSNNIIKFEFFLNAKSKKVLSLITIEED